VERKRKTRRADARKKDLGIPSHHYAYRSSRGGCVKHNNGSTYYCITCWASWKPCCGEKHPSSKEAQMKATPIIEKDGGT